MVGGGEREGEREMSNNMRAQQQKRKDGGHCRQEGKGSHEDKWELLEVSTSPLTSSLAPTACSESQMQSEARREALREKLTLGMFLSPCSMCKMILTAC